MCLIFAVHVHCSAGHPRERAGTHVLVLSHFHPWHEVPLSPPPPGQARVRKTRHSRSWSDFLAVPGSVSQFTTISELLSVQELTWPPMRAAIRTWPSSPVCPVASTFSVRSVPLISSCTRFHGPPSYRTSSTKKSGLPGPQSHSAVSISPPGAARLTSVGALTPSAAPSPPDLRQAFICVASRYDCTGHQGGREKARDVQLQLQEHPRSNDRSAQPALIRGEHVRRRRRGRSRDEHQSIVTFIRPPWRSLRRCKHKQPGRRRQGSGCVGNRERCSGQRNCCSEQPCGREMCRRGRHCCFARSDQVIVDGQIRSETIEGVGLAE